MDTKAMRMFGISIWREKPGVISQTHCWCCIHRHWLYVNGSLLGLIWNVVTEWKRDRHLVG